MRPLPRALALRLLGLSLGLSASSAFALPDAPAAPAAPDLADLWVGDQPDDAGGILAARWRNRLPDPPDRFWRLSVQLVGLPDAETGVMIPVVDSPVNWPKPGGLSTDYTAQDNWLRNLKAPFWWGPVSAVKAEDQPTTHWLTMDLAMHFPPAAEDAALKAKRDEIARAKGDAAKVAALEAELRLLDLKRDRALDHIRHGRYRVQLMYQDKGMAALQPVGEAFLVQAEANLWDWRKANNLVFAALLCGVILFFIGRARRKELFLRRIPGIDAVEEAIGRGTEMGRPIYFLTGMHGLTDVSTMAATTILGEVAKKVATYDTQLKVPHRNPMVMPVCQEITREAYLSAGRADAFQENANFFVTEDQFSFVAAVDGMMVREKPAACFYMGYYYAESLLLAETGSTTGAIQIAGTDADHQLPFFVTACDYTLIGEELYAASAYLSRDPVKVGTLRGQDAGKLVLGAFLVLGTLVATAAVFSTHAEQAQRILHVFKAF